MISLFAIPAEKILIGKKNMKTGNIINTFLMLFLASCIQVSESPTEESSDNLIGKYPTLSTKAITTKIMP